jgi:hypothetical protein
MRKSSRKNRSTQLKTDSKNRKRKTCRKSATESGRGSHHTAALTVAKERMRGTRRFMVDQFEDFRDAQVPATLRDLAERNVSQTRAL